MLMLTLLLSAAPTMRGENLELLGFTADGAKLAWLTGSNEVRCKQEPCEAGAEQETISVTYAAVVHDLLSDTQQTFKYERRPKGKGAPSPLADFAAFEAWKKANPLVKSKKPPAGGRAGVRVGKEEKVEFGEDPEEAVLYTALGSDEVQLNARLGGAGAVSSPTYSVEWFWDPTAKRVVFVETCASSWAHGVDIPAVSQLRVLGAGPVVSLLAAEGAAAARDAAAAKIEAAGFAVVSKGPAQKVRSATVVFSDKAHAAAAKKLAAALGGTAEPLTWKSKEPLVVAVGVPGK